MSGHFVVNQRRHAPVSRQRRASRAAVGKARHADGPLARLQRDAEGVFTQDHGDRRRGGRFRWFLSTCFAAGIGAFAILFSLLGANDRADPLADLGLSTAASTASTLPAAPQPQGLAWALPKSDKLVATSGAMSTKFIIYDSVHLRKDNRDYLQKKTYARIVARLAAAPIDSETDKIPPFNPYKLYATGEEQGENDTLAAVEQQDVAIRVVELLGGILPSDDGQDMNTPEITEVVAREAAQSDAIALKPAFQADGAEKLGGAQLLARRAQRIGPEPMPPNTTALVKTAGDGDDTAADDLEAREVRVVRTGRGDTLPKILSKLNTESWQVDEIMDLAKKSLGDGPLAAGQEVRVTLVPSVTKANTNEVARLSVFSDAQEHKLTIIRRGDGAFEASTTFVDDRLGRASNGRGEAQSAASLYASVYMSALSQGLTPDMVGNILRIHASETDFRRRVHPSDGLELFFGVKEEDKGTEGALGELLATALSAGGETQKYYRFRTVDGAIDFYDENGNNSRKFLMRKPVRGEVRLADGFGWRRHPLLNIVRRHAGIDWAGPVGTPIMAAGSGVVEEARRHGEFGNYVRIRHANGYSTAYAHMQRFAVAEGNRVTQGQVIGYIGTTGLSTGPHLHFEVLINSQQVNPMTIPVPKERRLEGKALLDFQKERTRIDELMRRNPVSTKVIEAQLK